MLLNKDPSQRLGSGSNGLSNIKNHQFFKGLDWAKVYNKEITSQYIPSEESKQKFLYFQIQDCEIFEKTGGYRCELLSEKFDAGECCNSVGIPMVDGFSFFKIK